MKNYVKKVVESAYAMGNAILAAGYDVVSVDWFEKEIDLEKYN